DAVNQIRMTPWACERTDTELIVRSDLAQAEFHSARYAVANVVVTTIDEDKSALLGVQNAGSATIEMAQDPETEDDRVVWCDGLGALRAGRGMWVRHLKHPRETTISSSPQGMTLVCVSRHITDTREDLSLEYAGASGISRKDVAVFTR